jgi:hypothetical protein
VCRHSGVHVVWSVAGVSRAPVRRVGRRRAERESGRLSSGARGSEQYHGERYDDPTHGRMICLRPASATHIPFNVCAVGHLDSQRSLPVFHAPAGGLSPLAKKLRFTAEQTVAVLNAPEGYLARLQPGPASIVSQLAPAQRYDAVQLFVSDMDELRHLGADAVRATKPDGLLWITYPKGGGTPGATDLPATPWWIKRDVLGEITAQTGYKPVAFVAVDDNWTALRFKRV